MKLTETQKLEIIKLSPTTKQKEIAKIFNVNQATISLFLRKQGLSYDRNRLNLGRLKVDINYFKNIDTKEKAYWLGYLCADGNIKKGKTTLISKDLEIIEKFKRDIDSEHKINNNFHFDKRTKKTYKSYSVQITNHLFVNNLLDKGVGFDKSNNLFFPDIEEKFYSYFMAGLFDGDGCVCLCSGVLRVTLISTKEMLLHIQNFILRNLNINKTKMRIKTDNKPNIWEIHLNGKGALSFLNYIYKDDKKDMYMSRKYNRFIDYEKLFSH